MSSAFFMVAVAIVLNVMTVVLLRVSDGATRFWPCVGVVFTIVPCQILLARAMGPNGVPVGPTIAVVVVAVLSTAAFVGLWYGEKLSGWQIAGLLLAVAGVVIAQFAGPVQPARPGGG